MFKKLGSDLLYLILKSIDRYNDPKIEGCVISPVYLTVIAETIETADEAEVLLVKKEILTELSEGDYLNNILFLDNLEAYFEECGISKTEDLLIYKIIKESFDELINAIE